MCAEVMEVGCAGRLRPAACWSALGPPGGGVVWVRPVVGLVGGCWPPALGGAGGWGSPPYLSDFLGNVVGRVGVLAPSQPHAHSCPCAVVHGVAEG